MTYKVGEGKNYVEVDVGGRGTEDEAPYVVSRVLYMETMEVDGGGI
jgi:hypothetical protein